MEHKITQSKGFTIIELLIVITVIGILVGITFGQFADSGKRGRDSERHADMTALKSHLEEYYQDKGGYPSAVLAATLPRVNPEFLISPDGATITNSPPVESEFVAKQTTQPQLAGPQYIYTAYPDGCTNHCRGFVLSSIIELPTVDYDNPLIVTGAYNN